MIRIGFVGAGAMGQCAHLANYTDLPGCEVTALAELRPNLAQAVAARYGIRKVYRDHRELLRHEELDAIVASQPFEIHGRLLPDLYSSGLPLFTEKPLARCVEVGERLLAASRESGVRHALGYHKRSDPATLFVREFMDRSRADGTLGGLRYVRILMPEGDWIAEGFTHLIRSDEPLPEIDADQPPSDLDQPGRDRLHTFVNYYIHQVNLLRHLLGESYTVEYADPTGVIMAVRSDSGVPGVIEMSPYRTTVDWQEEILIGFERGYIRLRLPAPLAVNRPGSVEVFQDPGGPATPETTLPQLPWVHAMRQQAIHFLRFVRGEATPLCQADEALDDLRIAKDYINLLRST